jgi:putative transposase
MVWLEGRIHREVFAMARARKHPPEKIAQLLRQIEADTANGKEISRACYKAGISEQTYYRWYREYVNLTVDQANFLKTLKNENEDMKRPIS